MDLKKIIDKKDEAAKYMHEEITLSKTSKNVIPVQKVKNRHANIWLKH